MREQEQIHELRVGAVPASEASHWRFTVPVLALSWLAVLLVFRETAAGMVNTWMISTTFGHGFLILPLSLYLIWLNRDSVADLPVSPNLWGLPVLAALSFGWLLANIAEVRVVQQLALVGMLQTLVWTVAGWQVTRALLFPLAFLFFAVPVGEGLIPPLQDFTAYFTVRGIELSGIPVLQEGRLITVSSGVWEVVEECSGVRYLIASMVLGSWYCHVTFRSWFRRSAYLLLFALAPILGNGLRAYSIVVLTHIGSQYSQAGFMAEFLHQMYGHLFYGWVVFAAMIVALFWVGSKWGEPAEAPPARTLKSNNRHAAPSLTVLARIAAAGIALLAAGPLAANALSSPAPSTAVITAIPLPAVSPPWEARAVYSGNWQPWFMGVDAETMQTFAYGSRQVHLYIGYYAVQREDAEVVHWRNTIADPERWARLADGRRRASLDGEALSMREMLVRQSGQTLLIWSAFWVDGKLTSNPYYAKLLWAKVRLFGGRQDAAVVAFASSHGVDDDGAPAIQDFLDHASVLPALDFLK